MNNNFKIGIVGAGIQGISNALFLQKKDLMSLYLIEMSQETLLLHMETLVISLHMPLYP